MKFIKSTTLAAICLLSVGTNCFASQGSSRAAIAAPGLLAGTIIRRHIRARLSAE